MTFDKPMGGGDSGGDERIGALFQPDTLINDQYLETHRRKLPLEPEQRLVVAVLEDGINAFQDNYGATNGKKQRLFEEAEAWIFNGEEDWIFSFTSVCAQLSLDPDYLRRGLRRWQEQQEHHGQRQGRQGKAKAAKVTDVPRRQAA